MHDFNEFVLNNGLKYCVSMNGNVTSTNSGSSFLHTADRLDRFFVNPTWCSFFGHPQTKIIPLMGSNNFPLLLEVPFTP